MITIEEYNELLYIAKYQHPSCYLDIVHDAISLGLNFKECLKKFKSLSHNYVTIKELNLLNEFTEKVCIKCNTVLPIAYFNIRRDKNILTTRNICKECANAQCRKWSKENPDKIEAYRDKYRIKKGIKKRVCIPVEDQKKARSESKKVWEQENKRYRSEYSRLRKKGIYITKDQFLKSL